MSRPKVTVAFTDRLRDLREKRKLSQATLARTLGVPPSAISHYENGRRRPSVGNLGALADALGVTTDHLLGRNPVPTKGPAGQLLRLTVKLSQEQLESLIAVAQTMTRRNKR